MEEFQETLIVLLYFSVLFEFGRMYMKALEKVPILPTTQGFNTDRVTRSK